MSNEQAPTTLRVPQAVDTGFTCSDMEYRRLGASGLRVPVLSYGTATFGGANFFQAWGNTDTAGATRLVDVCLAHGANMFDSGSNYSDGLAEEILGAAIKGRRDKVIISTKMTLPTGTGPNDFGSSRHHLIKCVDSALKRLDTDYIDLLQLHTQDSNTPVEETLSALDDIVRAGKARYIGCSNFAGWHLMKSLAVSDRHGYARYISQQVYYSLINRDYEWELMQLGMDQNVGAAIWSPLALGKLSGKIRRDRPPEPGTRMHAMGSIGAPYDEERLFRIVDAMDAISMETGKTIPQIALNWLLRKPTVATVIIGARNEEQLLDNLGAVGWELTAEQVARLDKASDAIPSYPTWFQKDFPMLNERGW